MGKALGEQAVELDGNIIKCTAGTDFQRRIQSLRLGSSGNPQLTFQHKQRTAPMLGFRSLAAAQLVALLNGSTLTPCRVLNGTTGMRWWGALSDDTGLPGPVAASLHTRHTGARGAVYLKGAEWSPGSPLSLACDAYFTASAGGTDPIATVHNAALPTAPTDDQVYVLTAATQNGVAIGPVQSVQIGIDPRCENNDPGVCYDLGLPHPVRLRQAGIGDSIIVAASITTLDEQATMANGDLVLTFTAASPDGFLGSATLTFTLNNCMVEDQGVGGSHGSARGRRLNMTAQYDGSTAPLTIVAA